MTHVTIRAMPDGHPGLDRGARSTASSPAPRSTPATSCCPAGVDLVIAPDLHDRRTSSLPKVEVEPEVAAAEAVAAAAAAAPGTEAKGGAEAKAGEAKGAEAKKAEPKKPEPKEGDSKKSARRGPAGPLRGLGGSLSCSARSDRHRPRGASAGGAGFPSMARSRVPRLVVGLGNPGPEYEWTPHNLGFHVVDALGPREGIDL